MMKLQWPQLINFTTPSIIRILNKLGNVPADVLAPSGADVFNALKLTSPDDVKVIIIGQDPYIRGEAHGLAFSSQLGMTPSLEVMFNELTRSGFIRSNPNLTDWAEQGVLLLNTILTTQKGISLAHEDYGWQEVTKSVVEYAIYLENPIVVLLWGQHARDFWFQIVRDVGTPALHNVHVLTSCHPVAEKRNGICFTGNNHFLLANEWLKEQGATPINWNDGSKYNGKATERR